MKALLAVARREIAEKRFVFAAAGVAAIVPFLAALIRSLRGDSASIAREWTALIFASLLASGTAVGLGATTLVSETASRRIGFYFSRPISSFALWAGKLGGSLTVVLTAFAIAIAPTLLLDRGGSPLRDLAGSTGNGLVIESLLLLLVLLMSNAVSTVLRSRSPLIVADLLIVGTLALAGYAIGSRLARVEIQPHRWIPAALAVAGAGLAIAGYRAVSRGRTDSVANHASLSYASWALGGIATAVFAAYASWVVAAPPSAISRLGASLVGADGWVLVWGSARGGFAEFLYDTRGARYERISGQPVASGNGKIAVWLDHSARSAPWFLRMRQLEEAGRASVPTTISYSDPDHLFLSFDGLRAGAIDGGVLSVWELASGRSLGSARIGDGTYSTKAFFFDSNLVRIFRWSQTAIGRFDILEFNLATRSLHTTGSIDGVRPYPVISVSRSRDRFVARESVPSRISLRDGRSGKLVATLREGPELTGPVVFLADGRIVYATRTKTGRSLLVFSADGSPRGAIDSTGEGRIQVAGEIAPGLLVFEWTSASNRGGNDNIELQIADVDKLTVKTVAANLQPIVRWWDDTDVPVGSEATRLFLDASGGLVHFDPLTGERRTILGR